MHERRPRDGRVTHMPGAEVGSQQGLCLLWALEGRVNGSLGARDCSRYVWKCGGENPVTFAFRDQVWYYLLHLRPK